MDAHVGLVQEIPGLERATFLAVHKQAIRAMTGCDVSGRALGDGPRILRVKGPANSVEEARQMAI